MTLTMSAELYCQRLVLLKLVISKLNRSITFFYMHSFQQPAETHLPRLLDDESMILPVIDMDGVDVWSLKFRLV